ncbi:MAG: serine hydrolase, partial [Clostridiaceae bacterium]
EGNINRVGFLFYDITTGKKIAINEDMVCVAASTYKVGMNVVAYDLANSGELDLSSTIWYNSGYYESGTGVLQNQISATLANPVPIQKLLDYSIIYSDNIATNMVSSYLGGANSVRKQVGYITGTTGIDITKNVITPEEEFLLLKKIYDNKDDANYSHLISIMKQTIFHDRIDKYIPQEITAHKIGNYGSYTNDVGIIFTDKPYIFVMYTNGVSDADELIADLSNLIYNEQLNR